jgi:hypothetical protein
MQTTVQAKPNTDIQPKKKPNKPNQKNNSKNSPEKNISPVQSNSPTVTSEKEKVINTTPSAATSVSVTPATPVTLDSILSIFDGGKEELGDANAPLTNSGINWLIQKLTLMLKTLTDLRELRNV